MPRVIGARAGVGVAVGYTVGVRNRAYARARPRRLRAGESLVVTGAISPIPRSQPPKDRGIELLAPGFLQEPRRRGRARAVTERSVTAGKQSITVSGKRRRRREDRKGGERGR